MQAAWRAEEPLTLPESVVNATGLARTDSMEITNDPRYFLPNIIDRRLAAFSGLGTISGLMTGTAIDQLYSMKKDIEPATFDGWLQVLYFGSISVVLYANLLATYVAVAQFYHTYRLMTAGSTGFEMARAYYLDKDMTHYRHLGIKSMLTSLPIFLMSSGCRMLFQFDKAAQLAQLHTQTATTTLLGAAIDVSQAAAAQDPHAPAWAIFLPVAYMSSFGLFFCLTYSCGGACLVNIHRMHMKVFSEKYNEAVELELPLLNRRHQHSLAALGRKDRLDV